MSRLALLLSVVVLVASSCEGDDGALDCSSPIPVFYDCARTVTCCANGDCWFDADGRRFPFTDETQEEVDRQVVDYCCKKADSCSWHGD